MKLIIIILVLLIPNFALGFNRHRCNTHCAQIVQVVQPVVIQSTVIIPTRQTVYPEIKGLRLVEDIQGNKYYEINGKIISVNSITQITTESIKNGSVTVEKTLIQ